MISYLSQDQISDFIHLYFIPCVNVLNKLMQTIIINLFMNFVQPYIMKQFQIVMSYSNFSRGCYL
ncbi:hypothetical protein pb186bvf_018033 [Paramecium bursaria]